MNHLVAIVGPTAIGKSRLAVRLVQALGGEIVSADSRQVYRFMDIGTAKPSPEELALVPHHLIGIVNPDDDFGLAQYQELAYRAVRDVQKRRKLALLVGGSGQYVWSLVEGWQIPRVAPDPELRRRLETRAVAGGGAELYRELAEVDPAAAQRISPHNIRRVIRALEVYRSSGVPFSQLRRKKKPPFKILIIGLTAPRQELYRRVDSRVDDMIAQGLVAEVAGLLGMGYSLSLPAMSGIGYRQMGRFLKGELTLDEATRQIKVETHRFVRHQYAWFQLSDARIRWFDIVGKGIEGEIMDSVTQFTEAATDELCQASGRRE
jgi:tRNA dimethylallyltransferase